MSVSTEHRCHSFEGFVLYPSLTFRFQLFKRITKFDVGFDLSASLVADFYGSNLHLERLLRKRYFEASSHRE